MRRIFSLFFLLACCTALAFGITITTTSLPTAQIGVAYEFQIQTAGASGGALIWSITSGTLPAGFVLDQNTGLICTGTLNNSGTAQCTGTAPGPVGSPGFTVAVTDSQAESTFSRAFSITVFAAGNPNITSLSPLPNGVLGQAYSFQFQESGGQSPFQWIEFSTSGTFPPNFNLDPTTGIFSSTGPTTAGTYNFQIEVRDTNGLLSSVKTFSLTISTTGLTIVNTSPLPSAAVGISYGGGTGLQLTASGGSSFYTWSLTGGAEPPGMNFTTSGLIYGTPTFVGTYSFTIQVNDVGRSTGTLFASTTFTMTVVSGTLSIVQTTLPFAIQNQSYSYGLTAQGGAAPYNWALGTTSVAGLTIDPNAGTISGTPTTAPGSYSIQVIVRDSVGNSFSFTFSLTIAANLSITTTTLPNAVSGQFYNQTISSAGGQAPYTWSVTGTLPTGLTFGSSSGGTSTISGTPTTNGSYTFTVKVIDNGSRTASQAFTLLVGTALVISTTSLPNGSQNVTYNQPLNATGGQSPYTWALTGGTTLPAGLTLSTTGTISGTPSGQGSSTFQVQVTDSQSNTANKTFTINIGVPLIITTVNTANASVGVAYSQPLGANGGTPPYTWTAASGLPPGITLASNSGLLSGTPTKAGSYNFTVTVTDSSSATAQRAYAINVISQLSLQGGTVTGTVGASLQFVLTAAGGVSPYTFAIQSGSLPQGINFSGATGQFTGTPTAAGNTSVVVAVSDASGANVVATISFAIALNAPPALTIGSFVPASGQQPPVTLTLGGTFPVPITGTVVLTFAPAGTDATVGFTNGSQSAQFTIPANSTTATFPSGNLAVVTGTVAGTITLRVTQELANGTDVTPNPAPQLQIVIAPNVPVITSVSCAVTSGGFTVSVQGYTNTRSMASGVFNFTAPSGSTLQTSKVEVDAPLASAFTTWFASTAANATGGQFLLTMPFTVATGATGSGVGVTATLGNSVGGSNTPAAVTCH